MCPTGLLYTQNSLESTRDGGTVQSRDVDGFCGSPHYCYSYYYFLNSVFPSLGRGGYPGIFIAISEEKNHFNHVSFLADLTMFQKLLHQPLFLRRFLTCMFHLPAAGGIFWAMEQVVLSALPGCPLHPSCQNNLQASMLLTISYCYPN